jgi:hypothetical protein
MPARWQTAYAQSVGYARGAASRKAMCALSWGRLRFARMTNALDPFGIVANGAKTKTMLYDPVW